MTDPLTLDAQLIVLIEEYNKIGDEEVVCLAGKFLKMVLTDAPLLEDVDEWFTTNSSSICQW
jgi:hypothetical protein